MNTKVDLKKLERLHEAIQAFKAMGAWGMVENLERIIEMDHKIVRFSYSKDAEKDGGRMTEKSGPNT